MTNIKIIVLYYIRVLCHLWLRLVSILRIWSRWEVHKCIFLIWKPISRNESLCVGILANKYYILYEYIMEGNNCDKVLITDKYWESLLYVFSINMFFTIDTISAVLISFDTESIATCRKKNPVTHMCYHFPEPTLPALIHLCIKPMLAQLC